MECIRTGKWHRNKTKKIQVVFVPLAYDNFGNRVGYGKGYYDKFLSKCTKECLKIGLSFSLQKKNNVHFFRHQT